MPTTILPAAASQRERELDAATNERTAGLAPAIIAAAWDADNCPAEFLPPLAWAMSVESWSPAWTEQQKRDAIKQSIARHRLKGTDAGVLAGLDDLGVTAEIEHWHEYLSNHSDWWNNDNNSPRPYTMRVNVDSQTVTVGEDRLREVIDANKRQSVLYELLHVSINNTSVPIGGAATAETYIDAQQTFNVAGIFASDVWLGVGFNFQHTIPAEFHGASITNLGAITRNADGSLQWIDDDTTPQFLQVPTPTLAIGEAITLYAEMQRGADTSSPFPFYFLDNGDDNAQGLHWSSNGNLYVTLETNDSRSFPQEFSGAPAGYEIYAARLTRTAGGIDYAYRYRDYLRTGSIAHDPYTKLRIGGSGFFEAHESWDDKARNIYAFKGDPISDAQLLALTNNSRHS